MNRSTCHEPTGLGIRILSESKKKKRKKNAGWEKRPHGNAKGGVGKFLSFWAGAWWPFFVQPPIEAVNRSSCSVIPQSAERNGPVRGHR
jgi:hypothetical protein